MNLKCSPLKAPARANTQSTTGLTPSLTTKLSESLSVVSQLVNGQRLVLQVLQKKSEEG
jgi:hypothetical protein